tara:strand:- start:483 stop:1424 length:942 start_codon:yes stop_codon:yes gene_type:complete
MGNYIPIELRDGNKILFFYETKTIGTLCEILFEFYVKKDKPHNKRNMSSIKRQAQGFNPRYVDSKKSKQLMTLKMFEPEMEYIFTLNPDETRELIKKINTTSREFKRIRSTKKYKSQKKNMDKYEKYSSDQHEKFIDKVKKIEDKISKLNEKAKERKIKSVKIEKQISELEKQLSHRKKENRKKHADYKEYRKKHGIIKARKKFKPTFLYGFQSKSQSNKMIKTNTNKEKLGRQLHKLNLNDKYEKYTLKYLEKDLAFEHKRGRKNFANRMLSAIAFPYADWNDKERIKLIKPVLIDQAKKNRNTKITFGPWG